MVLRTGLNSIWSRLIDLKRPWKKCKTWLMKVASPVEIVPHSAAATHVGCGVLSPSLSILFLRSRIDGRHPFGVKLRPCPGLRSAPGRGT